MCELGDAYRGVANPASKLSRSFSSYRSFKYIDNSKNRMPIGLLAERNGERPGYEGRNLVFAGRGAVSSADVGECRQAAVLQELQ
jgi:hypothetical protein